MGEGIRGGAFEIVPVLVLDSHWDGSKVKSERPTLNERQAPSKD